MSSASTTKVPSYSVTTERLHLGSYNTDEALTVVIEKAFRIFLNVRQRGEGIPDDAVSGPPRWLAVCCTTLSRAAVTHHSRARATRVPALLLYYCLIQRAVRYTVVVTLRHVVTDRCLSRGMHLRTECGTPLRTSH
ncbi:hypothetical protein J6590_032281 [Homalodisca vitripennis]|nr:hypothetical protein J6590_032281 [Homalodisca vitripennis]